MCSDLTLRLSRIRGNPSPLKAMIVVQVKPYVYEKINGKRKRVSPFVEVNGVITEIKKRAIVKVMR